MHCCSCALAQTIPGCADWFTCGNHSLWHLLSIWSRSRMCLRWRSNRVCVQAVEGREAALQQVEEARLALRAADRDNAELQARLQQASMSISSRHSQHAAPTARQLWAVPRERTGAIGSTAVSPVSRCAVLGCAMLCCAVMHEGPIASCCTCYPNM